MTGPRRVLAFDQDEEFLTVASRLLTGAGLEFLAVREPSQVMAQMAAFQPHLVLLDRSAKGTGFAQALELLRDSRVPLVFVLAAPGERELIRAVQAHAVEVMVKPFGETHVGRIGLLLEEMARRPVADKASWEEQVARNFMDLALRHNLRGSLVVNRGTPFEGRVAIRDGALLRASYGPLEGMDAVREMLQLEDGLYELDASLDQPLERVAHSATELEEGKSIALGTEDLAELRPRLLVVDDEQDIVVLLAKSLARAGFEVAGAHDGQEAVDLALKSPVDLILADLSMPRMDGWEMLRILKGDHRTSEVPVVVISAHDDYRETLRAARAGAYDYLAKGGRSEVVVAAALRAITPRLDVLFHLLMRHAVEVRTQAVGLQWLLRALARRKATGRLTLEDDWGTYLVEVRNGRPVTAESGVQQRKVSGLAAFVRMMVATAAHGMFQFTEVQEGRGGLNMAMEDLILRTCETLNGAEARANERAAGSPSDFDVDVELYELFCRVVPPKKVAFARAVVERKLTLAEVTKALLMTPAQSGEWFNELLRRGVIRRPARNTRTPMPPAPTHPPVDRRKTLLAMVRQELGEAPWVSITEALEVSLVSKLDHELTFPELVQFARTRGFDWRDVYTVVSRLTVKGLLQRTSLGADIAPPPLVRGPDVEDKQLAAWTEWGRRAQPVWRSALGS